MERATVWRSGGGGTLVGFDYVSFFGAFLSKLMRFFVANDMGMTRAPCKLNLERIRKGLFNTIDQVTNTLQDTLGALLSRGLEGLKGGKRICEYCCKRR